MEELLSYLNQLVSHPLFGTIASFIATKIYRYAKKVKPLSVSLERAHFVPEWYLTNRHMQGPSRNTLLIAKEVSEQNPFCGFAHLQFEIINLTSDPVDIEDIEIIKESALGSYDTRIQIIPQGGSKHPIDLIALIDKDDSEIYENFDQAINNFPGFFEYGSSISLDPKERRVLNLTVICLSGDWNLSFAFGFVIGKRHGTLKVTTEPNTLVYAYDPSKLQYDSNQFAGILGDRESFGDKEPFTRYAKNPSRENRMEVLKRYESLVVFDY